MDLLARPYKKIQRKTKYQYLLNKDFSLHSNNQRNTDIGASHFSEAQGRDWRFRCISRLYSTKAYKIALTGHTATDRSETALLQLIRGTSFRGMASLSRTKTFKLVYPKYFNYSVFLFN